jgi:phosphocarrier protein
MAALVVATILVPTGGATPVSPARRGRDRARGALLWRGAARAGEWGRAGLLVLAWATFRGRAMKEARLVVLNQDGFHARPCSAFVHMASRFKSEIYVRRDDVEVNAKSLLGVMMLAAETGAELIVRAEGPDEDEAIAALTKLAEEKFGTE